MTDEASDVLSIIISCEISRSENIYAPGDDKAVVPISSLVNALEWTKYRTRKALKELRELGLIEYTSQGCPAIVSYGEITELICEAQPPINGYALTEQGFETELYKQKYAKWKKDLEEWANDENNV